MKKSLLLLATLGTLTACQTQPATDAALQTMANDHLDFMRQQADLLANEFTQLQQASADYCQQTDVQTGQQATPSLSIVTQQWRSSFAAWSAHQGQSGGPLDAEGLSFAFQFWPDKKDTVGKQVRRELAAVAKGDAVPDRGVVTTLSAVEYLLESELSAHQRCLLLPGITAQLASNGKQLQGAWYNADGYQQQLAQMQQQGGATVLLTQVLGQLSHRYDLIEKKFELPLNTVQHPRPLFAEAWRSEQSLHFLRTSLMSLEQEYRQGGMRDYLLQNRELQNSTPQTSNQHQATVEALDEAFADALAHLPAGDSLSYWLQGDNYAKLLRFKLSFDQLGYQLQQRLPGELGLSLGFNATDGD
ncbi:imelysin family protein [Oceanisphaera ostreae]|uniref:Imelysin family protein n=1 Tax=Oceanisphaera ostreae TaxID=914151 RepID=A0ABW3KEU5_9GAMM